MAPCYLDENVAEILAEFLQRRGHDAVTTSQLGNKGLRDVQQLLVAIRTGRILVTHDARDFPMLHEAWHELARLWGVTRPVLHPGILIMPPTRRLAADEAARLIDELLARVGTVENRLFDWKIGQGWIER